MASFICSFASSGLYLLTKSCNTLETAVFTTAARSAPLNPSVNSAIPHNLSYTDDGGETWGIVSFFKDIGAIVYDLNFEDNNLYASTSLGLYKTYNGNIANSAPACANVKTTAVWL